MSENAPFRTVLRGYDPAEVDARLRALSQQAGSAQAASDELVEQARTDAGADAVRTLRPGQAVTLEFNGARLNVEVDEDNRIVSLRCG